MNFILFHPLVYFLFHLMDIVSSIGTQEHFTTEKSVIEVAQIGESEFGEIRKCYCGANLVWEHGNCLTSNTSVDVILRFSPLKMEKMSTAEIDKVAVGNLACVSATSSLVKVPAEIGISSLVNVAVTTNNTLMHLGSGEQFTKYCLEHVIDERGRIVVEAFVCLPVLSIPSCCPPQQLFNSRNFKCYKANTAGLLQPPIRIGSSIINSANIIPRHMDISTCSAKSLKVKPLISTSDISLQYQSSKIILFEWDDKPHVGFPKQIRFPTEYCIAINMSVKSSASKYLAVFWNESLLCTNKSHSGKSAQQRCEDIMYLVLLPLLVISTVFLVLILALHAALPELRKSLGSKVTMCHVASLLAGFCLLIVLHIPHDFNCKVYGPLLQIFFLAAFFWLNVMCFDIWWKLRCHYPVGESTESSNRRFLYYSLYAWSGPVMFGVASAVMDNMTVPSGFVRPNFGLKNCWFADPKAALVYYFGIVAFLMVLNVLFFVWVFVILVRANFSYNKVLRNNSKTDHKRTWVYLKIFGIMGVTWLCEYLSWEEGTCKYWVVTDVINALRGLILFIIFFCNRKSAKKIREYYANFNKNVHRRFSQSVESIRKLSLHSPSSVENGSQASRTSETNTNTELSNRAKIKENEISKKTLESLKRKDNELN